MRRTVFASHYKITPNQRWCLIQVYLHMGMAEAVPLCKEWGVSPTYARNCANALGWHKPRPHSYKKTPDPKFKRSDKDDPRWQWAKERGAVVV